MEGFAWPHRSQRQIQNEMLIFGKEEFFHHTVSKYRKNLVFVTSSLEDCFNAGEMVHMMSILERLSV